jgi:ribosomal-protein-alanine N-acetyltransferase
MYREIGDYILRDWRLADAPAIAKHANNRKIWLRLRDAFPHPYGIEDAKSFIARVSGSQSIIAYAIATESDAIGSIGLVLGKDVHRFTAEIGYWLAEPFWGKGIMTDAVRLLSDWALHEMKLHRISAEPYSTNQASHRVLEKSGYFREGILRSSAFKDGQVLDQVVYSRTRSAG